MINKLLKLFAKNEISAAFKLKNSNYMLKKCLIFLIIKKVARVNNIYLFIHSIYIILINYKF